MKDGMLNFKVFKSGYSKMKKTIVLMLFLLILVFTFTSCKSDVSDNYSRTDLISDVYIDANGSSANTDEEPSNTTSNIVDDWNNDTVSIEITGSNSVNSNESNEVNSSEYATSNNSSDSNNTVSNESNKSNETNSDNNTSSEQDDNTSSVISVPEFYEGRY
jgi:hypothetical protein